MSSYIYNLTDTWNQAGTTFNSIKMNVTDTASASDSKLLDLQISGNSKFNINKTGNFYSGAGNIDGTLTLQKDYTEKVYYVSGSSLVIDLTNGTIQKLTTTANASITLPTSVVGKSYMVVVEYGGSHLLTFSGGSTIKWAGGFSPTPTSVAGKIDIFTFFCDGTSTFAGIFGQNF